ncbi:glycoside hydrolase family 3 C-terminal domain-containing protein [Saccharothrix sp. S26]|uniref:beta-glucosidase family protein n=1 Tax=Saccharothrix sp. S26 TaxID=2907215 RepID=UPI001F277730|nr:glycoside hydrolase family 3 C-terminal domain-containing protein [Saccharothrix sp. S26]MCE6998892.1 glycoside hydrolase family 3 C-terminal domain-containing protein [Saccharothrix sp. S26]
MDPLPFRDPGLPVEDRVTDLLGRLTDEEKVALLHQHQPAVPRLGLAGFHTGMEVLHGVAWLGPATVFPQAVGLASSWDLDLVRRVGEAVGVEARGFHHRDPVAHGLNVWAPVVNPLRDPRWGRNEEGYSEDPTLTAAMGTAYATGLRGDHPRYLRTAPTLKHFLGYNNEDDRCVTSSDLRPRVLHEYELPCFRGPVEAGAAVAVMPSYNLVNGRPAHLSPLIEQELRTWAPDGLAIVSDAYAPSNVAGLQAYLPTQAEGHAALLNAGLDSFTDQDADPTLMIESVTTAIKDGLLDWSVVDRAVGNVLALRIRLGEFDPADDNPYASITSDVIGTHGELALEAARQAVVVLRNDSVLPLRRGAKLAVIGTHADALFEDWYSGTLPYQVTVRRGLEEFTSSVDWAEGADRIALRAADGRYLGVRGGVVGLGERALFDRFDWGDGVWTLRDVGSRRYLGVAEDGSLVATAAAPGGWDVRELFEPRLTDGGVVLRNKVQGTDTEPFEMERVVDGIAAAAEVAKRAETVVLVLGNDPHINGRETQDRTTLRLPSLDLVRAVREANPNTVLVLVSSYPYALDGEEEHLPAVVWTAHGGQEQGRAVAEALFGAFCPSGKLTQTWYRSDDDLPDIFDYDIIRAGGTYLYFTGEPLFPFGHGLSYTTFEYSELTWADGVAEVSVTNTGDVAGAEVVQLYSSALDSRVRQPVRKLQSFQRVRLAPGETAVARLRTDQLWHWDVTTGRRVVEAGRYELCAGSSSRDIRSRLVVDVPGETIAPRVGALPAPDFDDCDGVRLVDDEVVFTREGAWISFHDVTPGSWSAPPGTRVEVDGTTLVLTAETAGVRVREVR